ncbi:histone acetyltransferases subunit 3-domain-containing protein [Pilobolus umbonatus]|nr:histone acetyltransferases subunit 3-domain-containing protein [Pilobolus umbonatus]
MNSELTRRYSQPVPVSAATSLHYRQYKNSTSVASSLGSIPDPQDLLNIKADLEAILPISEKRIRNFQRDLSYLKKNVKIREIAEEHKKENNAAVLDKMQIKQESIVESSDMLHSSHNKNQMERQHALELLRRKRRRDDSDSKEISGTGRTDPSNHLVKLKRIDEPNIRSVSPPLSKSHTKSAQGSLPKKKKTVETAIRGTHGNKQSQNVKNRANHHHGNNNHLSNSVPQEVDFVRVKAKDQVPILNFWAVIDPHFKPLSEEDRELLLKKPDDEKYHIIPPLGRHYSEIWSEDEQLPSMSRSNSPATSSISGGSRQGSHDHIFSGKYNHSYTSDDQHLYKDDGRCGNLTERLLSSLLSDTMATEKVSIAHEEEEEDIFSIAPTDIIGRKLEDNNYIRSLEEMTSISAEESAHFEERLKRELRYAGLFGEDDVNIDWNTREDNEICAELRMASRELKKQHKINEYRKKKLLAVVDNQLQYEQYRHVLDNLDAQVEQCYLKRFRIQKSKKRKAPASQKSALSEHAVHAMSKRKAWIDALEGIFKDKNLIMPSRSIYCEDEEECSNIDK